MTNKAPTRYSTLKMFRKPLRFHQLPKHLGKRIGNEFRDIYPPRTTIKMSNDLDCLTCTQRARQNASAEN